MNIFGTIMIYTDEIDKWLGILQDNIRINAVTEEEEYIAVYCTLGNFIISPIAKRHTASHIEQIIVDKPITDEEYLQFFYIDITMTENGRFVHEEKLEKTEE